MRSCPLMTAARLASNSASDIIARACVPVDGGTAASLLSGTSSPSMASMGVSLSVAVIVRLLSLVTIFPFLGAWRQPSFADFLHTGTDRAIVRVDKVPMPFYGLTHRHPPRERALACTY